MGISVFLDKSTCPSRSGHGINVDLFSRSEVEQSIVSRFRSQVARHPDRAAIRTQVHEWTYAQLANVVDQFADLILSRYGLSSGRIALLFTHDAPMCAAMLAVLQAGKAYVPLDPTYPPARLDLIYQDSEPDGLFVDSQCLGLAGAMFAGGMNMLVADIESLSPDRTVTRDWPAVAPRDLAYVLYTSGSTGRPKGVIQNHRNVLHFICEYTRNLGITPEDALTLLSSYAFDAAVMSTYGALLNGATLCPMNVKANGFAAIGSWLELERISIYHSTPTVYREFLRSQPAGKRFPAVRLVVLGGEPVTRSDVEAFNRHFAEGTTLINGLGPTESTVTLQNFIRQGDELPTGPVSVGTPVGSTEVLLLDERGGLVEEEGELAFCSDHLALGYWRRPDQDEAAFHFHPLDATKRIYRTGDLARRNLSGAFHYLGRKDLQVKVNGVRIELEEIEHAVERLAEVRQCVALAQTDASEKTIIVGYVVLHDNEQSVDSLRDSLRSTLPDALIPQRFVAVREFPLTPTNKVDRKALGLAHPVPSRLRAVEDETGFEVADEAESVLFRVWQEVLGQAPAQRSSDFFQLGADSMMTMRLADGIEQTVGRRIDLGSIFSAKTFAGIAAMIRSGDVLSDVIGEVVALSRHSGNRGEHLFCLCGIQLYQSLADAIGPPTNVSGVFLPIETRILRGEKVPPLEEVAAMYLEVILKQQPLGPYRIAGVSFGGMLAYEIARQLHALGHEMAYLGIFDTILPHTIGTAARLGAHLRLALKHGPSYFKGRLKRKPADVTGKAGCPGEMLPRMRDELAFERGAAYTAALSDYRRNMPSYDGDAHFYRAAHRSEFEKACFPLDCNWGRYVKGRLTTYEVEGGHVSMLDRPFVDVLARLVRADMRLEFDPITPTAGLPAKACSE